MPPVVSPLADHLTPAAHQLAEQQYTILDNFISTAQVRALNRYIRQLYRQDALKTAGVGSGSDYQKDRNIRGDKIRWIDTAQAGAETKAVLDKLHEWRQILNRECFLGLKDLETHFTFYPSGTFYKKHVDQFRSDDHRKVSFVLYLNEHWQPQHGGQLRLYKADGTTEDVAPLGGRFISFRADVLPHEVLPVGRERYSITGWMLDQLNELTWL